MGPVRPTLSGPLHWPGQTRGRSVQSQDWDGVEEGGVQSQATRVSLPPSTRRMDDHGEWAGVPPTLKACRSRQRAPGRTGTVGVRRGWGGVGAPLPCWAGKLGALTAIFKTISNNDRVPTDASQVSGVSSGCVVPAPFLTPAAHGSCPVSLVSASGLHSPQPLRSDPCHLHLCCQTRPSLSVLL